MSACRRGRLRVAQIVEDRGVQQERILRDDGDLLAQRLDLQVAHVDAIDQHGAAGRIVQPHHQRRQRRLARAGRPDQSDRRARRHVQIDARQHLAGVVVGERRRPLNSTSPTMRDGMTASSALRIDGVRSITSKMRSKYA